MHRAGLSLILGSAGAGPGEAAGFLQEWWLAFVAVLGEAGWWLVIGFAIAGLLRVLVPESFVRRHLGRRGFAGVWRASLTGLPIPLCSCSVIPMAAGLRRQGASKGAAAAFAVSTPEVDVPSAAITWGLMGPWMAIARPIGALATALTAGVLIDATDRRRDPDGNEAQTNSEATASACCSHPPSTADSGAPECCVSKPVERRRVASAAVEAARFGLLEMPRDLAVWLLIGLGLSALLAVAVPDGWLEGTVGGGWIGMALALVISVPFYICATSSTPLAAVLIAKGLSPGAALVLLLAGPATNTTTMAWVVRDLGWRALAVYVSVIAALALAAGAAYQALGLGVLLSPEISAGDGAHEHGAGGWTWGAAALGALLAVGLVRRISGATLRQRVGADDACAAHGSAACTE